MSINYIQTFQGDIMSRFQADISNNNMLNVNELSEFNGESERVIINEISFLGNVVNLQIRINIFLHHDSSGRLFNRVMSSSSFRISSQLPGQVPSMLNEAYAEIQDEIDKGGEGGSGITIIRIETVTLLLTGLNGGCYKSSIKSHKGALICKNNDFMCLMYCLKLHKQRVLDDRAFMNRFSKKKDFYPIDLDPKSNIVFPKGIDFNTFIQFNEIKKIETANQVKFYIWANNTFKSKKRNIDGNLIPDIEKVTFKKVLLYVNEKLDVDEKDHVHIYFTENHFSYIYDLDKFLGSRMFYCETCRQSYVRKASFDKHKETPCTKAYTIKMPKDEDRIKKFSDTYEKEMKYAIFSDFEAMLIKRNIKKGENSTIISEHVPIAIGFLLLNLENGNSDYYEKVGGEPEEIYKWIRDTLYMIDEDTVNSRTVNVQTNLGFTFKKPVEIPIFFHNGKNYDANFIIKAITSKEAMEDDPEYWKIRNNSIMSSTKYKKIIFGGGRNPSFSLLDSVSFLGGTIAGICKSLKDDDRVFMKKYFLKRYIDASKQYFPYEWLDDIEKLDQKEFPDQGQFWSNLKLEGITDEGYQHAKLVYETHCEKFSDYISLYLKGDITILADALVKTRNLCLEVFKLDPFSCVTMQSLSWKACLKMTEIELELITDYEMYRFFSNGIRGGLSVITHRHADAREKGDILYLDANNLYGYAMSKSLPYKDFKWIDDRTISTWNKSLDTIEMLIPACVLEVDLVYDEEDHDRFNDLPPCSESKILTKEMISPYSRKCINEDSLSFTSNSRKLVASLENKKRYIIHHDALKFAKSLGVKITRIHRAVGFEEKPWMKPYVDWCSKKRAQVDNDFEKDFFKLLVNSCYGKTLQNVYNYKDSRFCYTSDQVARAQRKPHYKSMNLVDGTDIFQLNFDKSEVVLDQPIYCGFSILEHSKILMYDFHYNVVQKNAPDAQLLFTDTDSLAYYFPKTKNFLEIEDVKKVMDFSNYPHDHHLFSNEFKKVPGFFKDESPPPHAIDEFVGLRAKCYSYTTEGNKSCNKAKGINYGVVQKTFKIDLYKDALLHGKKHYANCVNFVQNRNVMYTVETKKMALNRYDDKRYLKDDGVSSYAYGHWRISEESQIAKEKFINFFV